MTTAAPSAAELRSLLEYNPETGELRWRKRVSNAVRAGDTAGSVGFRGHVQVIISGKKYQAHRLIWLWMTGEWPDAEIDHINRQRADNRWANLRRATKIQNARNRSVSKRSKTGVNGVTFDAVRGTWKVSLGRRHVGYFGSLEAAADARARAEAEYWGSAALAAAARNGSQGATA